jgi:hypothetical protein
MPRYFDLRVSIRDIEPTIWRRFLLAGDSMFEALHEAIQDSFGWDGGHLFEFRDLRGRDTLARADFDDPDADDAVPTVGELKLGSFFTKGGTKCLYIYDFGDNWEHVVEFNGMVELPESVRRRLLDGARACPPEDCGGIGGYENCVEVVSMSEKDIRKSDDAEEMLDRKEWIGDWNPEAFDLRAAKDEFDE